MHTLRHTHTHTHILGPGRIYTNLSGKGMPLGRVERYSI